MSIEREDVGVFSELDAEKRITLLLQYVSLLQGQYKENPRNSTDNIDVNVALKAAYKLLEAEFGK